MRKIPAFVAVVAVLVFCFVLVVIIFVEVVNYVVINVLLLVICQS